MRLVFFDTWAYCALVNRRDPDHDRSRDLHAQLLKEGAVSVTTNYVLDEALTFIRRVAGSGVACDFGTGIYRGVLAGLVRYERIDSAREAQAFRHLTDLRDLPRLSFTDCTSFAVMRSLGIREVFTGDQDFRRAGLGFRLLP